VAICSDKDILWLEVTIDDESSAQSLNSLNSSSGIEAGAVTPKATPPCGLRGKITTGVEILS